MARSVLFLARRLEVDVLGILIVVGAALSLSWGLFVAAGEAAADPGRPQPRRSAQRCPYCRSRILAQFRRCSSCATLHHLECWREHAGCSIYGCPRAGVTSGLSATPPERAPEREPEAEEPSELPKIEAQPLSEEVEPPRVVTASAG